MRRLRWILPAGLALLLAVPPALAVDLGDTTWELNGRSRVWARSVGRDFGPASAQVVFAGDGTFSLTGVALGGTWIDDGGRRFSGEIDDAAFRQLLEDFIDEAAGVTDATVSEVRVDRMWGHVSRSLERVKIKVRVKVRFASDELGVQGRGAWIKLRLRGRLIAGDPVVVE